MTRFADECIFEHSRLKPPACSSIDVSTSNAEWAELNLQQIEVPFLLFWDRNARVSRKREEIESRTKNNLVVNFSLTYEFRLRFRDESLEYERKAASSTALFKRKNLNKRGTRELPSTSRKDESNWGRIPKIE